MLNRHITQAHGPKINKAFSLCGHRPHGEAACALLYKKGEGETLQSNHFGASIFQNQSQPGQQEGRGDSWSAWSAENTRGAHSEQSTCCLFSDPMACHLLEIYDSFSVTGRLLPGATPLWWMVVLLHPPPIICSWLSPGRRFSFSYKALLLNKHWAHFSKSMKLPGSPERDILTTNHAYYFIM